MMKETKRGLIVYKFLAVAALLAAVSVAEESQRDRENLSEPVMRVASRTPKHPLDPPWIWPETG